MPWVGKSFGKTWVGQTMASDCYGPNPSLVFKKYVERIDSTPYYQYELFSVFEEEIFDYNKMGFRKSVWYNFLPYTKALEIISAYEK